MIALNILKLNHRAREFLFPSFKVLRMIEREYHFDPEITIMRRTNNEEKRYKNLWFKYIR